MTPDLQHALDALTDALAAGRITVPEWHLAVMHALGNRVKAAPLDELAGQLATQPTIDADAVKRQLHALAAPPPAQPAMDTGALPTSAIAIDAATLAYFASLFGKERSGAEVAIPTVDQAVFGRYAEYYTSQVEGLANALVKGDITVEDWHLAMAHEIANVHSTAYMVGKGGADALDSQDFAAINTKVIEQSKYLDGWAAQLKANVASGNAPSAAAITARANLYMNAANASLQRGVTEALGMPELPAYAGDGSSECRTNDQCFWDIQKLPGNGNFDAYWRLNPAEHCETCLQRAEVWSPLQIRDGVILPYPEEGLFAA